MCERQALKGSHCKRPPTFVKQCFGRTEWKGPTWSVLLLMRPKGDVFEKLQFLGRAAFEFYGSMSCGFGDSADYSENHKNIPGCGSSIMKFEPKPFQSFYRKNAQKFIPQKLQI